MEAIEAKEKKTKTLLIRLDEKLAYELKVLSAIRRKSRNKVIEECVQEFVEKSRPLCME